MSPLLLLVAALSGVAAMPAAAAAAGCRWDDPGRHRYTGSYEAAVGHYADIPAPVRAALSRRMSEHRYDDVATIGRDRIEGRDRYGSELRDMHFGAGRVCEGEVDRSVWAPGHVERGLVYCEGGHCLIVPTVCNNVSRITRLGTGGALAGGPPPAGGAAPLPGIPRVGPVALPPSGGPGGGEPGLPQAPMAPSVYADVAWPATPAPGIATVAAVSADRLLPAAGGAVPGVPVTWVPPAAVIPAVPEPSTQALWAVGVAAVGWAARRLRRARD